MVLLAAARMGRAADGPPVAPVRAVVEDYFGTKISDPYRYMENLSDHEVQAWIKGQAAYSERALSRIAGRDRLFERIVELDAGAPYRISVVRRWPNGDLHYLKRMADENLDKLYFREAKTGTERLLVDPERFATPGGAHAALEFCMPSPDGRYVAYGIAAAGSEQTTLYTLDAASGKDLPDTIDRMESDYTPPSWLADSSGFGYSRRRQLASDAPATEGYKKTQAFLHKLGRDAGKDPVIFAMGSSPGLSMTETDFPSLVLTSGSRYVIGKIKHGDANELTLYAAPVESLSGAAGDIAWKRICDIEDEVNEFAVHGSDVYLMTASNAPRFKVLRTNLAAPSFARAEEVVPPSRAVIQSLAVARDGLYVDLLDGGLGRVTRMGFGPNATAQPIELPPGDSSGYAVAANPDTDGVFLSTTSWTRAGRIYAFDSSSSKLTDTGLRPRGKYDDPQGLESEEVQVASNDGVMVPLSIIHKRGIALDASHPTILGGYGAYGMVTHVHFNPVDIAWLERGGVIAHAHVRGGGEYGKEWHLAGRRATKPNTWKDFIACAEYLVKKGYTSPAKLAGQGGSAGGILIGRAITERPNLFAAAIINVGCLDMLRMETTTNGVPNIPEFGSTQSLEGFKGLFEMSAYHHVTDGVKYPAVILTHGINDPRVEPWMSAKMTARLQAANTSRKPILLRMDYDAGHGIGSTKDQRQRQLADEWAFLLWQMGELLR